MCCLCGTLDFRRTLQLRHKRFYQGHNSHLNSTNYWQNWIVGSSYTCNATVAKVEYRLRTTLLDNDLIFGGQQSDFERFLSDQLLLKNIGLKQTFGILIKSQTRENRVRCKGLMQKKFNCLKNLLFLCSLDTVNTQKGLLDCFLAQQHFAKRGQRLFTFRS